MGRQGWSVNGNNRRGRSWHGLLTAVLVAAVAFSGLTVTAADDDGRRVVVVYNTRHPDSEALAREYAKKRGIPVTQLCPITVRPVETITRKEFDEQVRAPIRAFLVARQLVTRGEGIERNPFTRQIPARETDRSAIDILALVHGVPLRIENDPRRLVGLPVTALDTQPQAYRNEAAVDSELALLPTDDPPLEGFVGNLLFRKCTVAFGHPLNRYMLLVGRLDGPTAAVVRRMIDDTLEAERIGLHGRVYFDGNNAGDPGYAVADEWLRTAAAMFTRMGYPTTMDERPELLGTAAGVEDVAVYGGWYAPHVAGVFATDTFRFRPGAVAYHLHSMSASSLRGTRGYWAGPLLHRGAAATMGNVYEPYLQLTPQVDLFYERLAQGGTFLEAAYCSQPALSWQTTFVGDPLYRPFRTSLDEQVRVLETEQHPDREWAYLRQVNLLALQGDVAGARALCAAQAERLASAVLYERLGQLAGSTDALRRAVALGEQQEKPGLVRRVQAALAVLDTELPRGE